MIDKIKVSGSVLWENDVQLPLADGCGDLNSGVDAGKPTKLAGQNTSCMRIN